MNDDSLMILPSEALLLGLCVGEYETIESYWRTDRIAQFAGILRDRLIPLHARPLVNSHEEGICSAEIPQDILWKRHIDVDYAVGWSPSDPDAAYHSFDSEKTNLRLTFTLQPEAVFIRHLLSELEPHIWVPYWMVANGFASHVDLTLAHAHVIDYGHSDDFVGPNGESGQKYVANGVDDYQYEHAPDVAQRIEELVRRTDVTTSFNLGREFGRLLALLGTWLEGLEWCAEGEFDDWIAGFEKKPIPESSREFYQNVTSDIQATIDDVLAAADAYWKDTPYLKPTLESLKNTPFDPEDTLWQTENYLKREFGRDITWPYERGETSVRERTDEAMGWFWFAFGQVMQAMKPDDELKRLENAAKVSPLSLQAFLNGSHDKIREVLKEAELWLEYRQSEAATSLVTDGTSLAVQRLCSRMWPEEFAKPKASVGDVLASKLRLSKGEEQRFASIGLTLHKSYRNPASHEEPDRSRREAKFVLCGLYAMLDLLETLRTPSDGE